MIILDDDQIRIGIAGKTIGKAYVYVIALIGGKITPITHEVSKFIGWPTNGPNMVVPLDGAIETGPELLVYERLHQHRGVWWDIQTNNAVESNNEIKGLKGQVLIASRENTTLREKIRLLEKDIKVAEEKANEAAEAFKEESGTASHFQRIIQEEKEKLTSCKEELRQANEKLASIPSTSLELDDLKKQLETKELEIQDRDNSIIQLKADFEEHMDAYNMYFEDELPGDVHKQIELLDKLKGEKELADKFVNATGELIEALERLQPAIEKFRDDDQFLNLHWPARGVLDAMKEVIEAQYERTDMDE